VVGVVATASSIIDRRLSIARSGSSSLLR
jgi:hypothetical protein